MWVIKSDIFLSKTLCVLAFAVLFLQVIGQDALVSMVFSSTFGVTLLLWLSLASKRMGGQDFLFLAIAALAFAGVCVNAYLSHTAPSVSYLKKLIIFVSALMLLQSFSKASTNEGIERLVIRLSDIAVLYLLAAYVLNTPSMYYFKERLSDYLTFGFTNPNLTAMFLSCLFMMEVSQVVKNKIGLGSVVHLALALVVGFFILETKSRNCQIVLFVFLVCVLFFLLSRKTTFSIGGFSGLLIAILPAILFLVYMFLVDEIWFHNAFSFMIDHGKELDSRVAVWRPALEAVASSPVFGAYSQISEGTGLSQMHNSLLDVLASYGIIVLVLVSAFLANFLSKKGRVYEYRKDGIYIVIFACILVMGFGEAALFSGGLVFYIFAGLPLLLISPSGELADE